MDCFLKLSNGIKGESRDADHKDWIDVQSWSWGMMQAGTTHRGGGGGGGRVDVNDMAFTKETDSSTPDLIKKCCDGTHIDDGELVVRKAGGAKPLEYFKMKMWEIIVTSYNTGGMSDGLDRPQESLTLNFSKFKISYQKQNNKGAAEGGPANAGWDIGENVAV
jgi:type VI secretion system secreted protein Hcp